tara:strand:+ start:124 stop:405 length:282 start_codon:yes stop_codon:yes gene_type:complete
MRFVPVNRHLLVEPLPEAKEEPKILLPEDYHPKEQFAVVNLLRASPESNSGPNSYHWKPGRKLIVNAAMLEEIKIEDRVFHVILENYVVGVLS